MILYLFFSFPSSRHQVPFTYYNLLRHMPLYMCITSRLTSRHITSHHFTSHHITSHHNFLRLHGITSYQIIAAITTTTFLLLFTVLQYISHLLTHVHTYYTYYIYKKERTNNTGY